MKASIAKRRRITKELRQEIVLGLKLNGMTDRGIVKRLKEVHNVTVSHVIVNGDWHAALDARQQQNDAEVQDFFDVTNARYERVIQAFWLRAICGDAKAADVVGRNLMAIRKLNGLDRNVGEEFNPYAYNDEDAEYDYARLSNEQLEELAKLTNIAKVVDIGEARRRFAI